MIDKYPMKVKMFYGSMSINWEEQIKSNIPVHDRSCVTSSNAAMQDFNSFP